MLCATVVAASGYISACAPAPEIAPNHPSSSLTAADSTEAVRDFVQAFYDWYVPLAIADTIHIPASYYVLNKADRYLDSRLAAALREDSIAAQMDEMKQTREILNFDPFLESQDPCGPYEVIDVRRRGDAFIVPVRACHGKGGPVVEVRRVGGGWRISNMLDLDGGRDLMSYLCEWAKADLRSDRMPATC